MLSRTLQHKKKFCKPVDKRCQNLYSLTYGQQQPEATMDDYYRLGLHLIEENERDMQETGRKIDAEVDNMTAEDLQQFCEDANTDDLWEVHRKLAVSAIDKDWPAVEAHTKSLVDAIKNHLWSNAK
jgi:hypothetical protein